MSTVYTYNNKVLKNSTNDKWLTKYVDPYNPLGLPDATIRFKFTHGETPSWYFQSNLYTLTLISEDPSGDIYDWTCPEYICAGNFSQAIQNIKSNLLAVLGMNTNGGNVGRSLSLECQFMGCVNLTEVGPLYTPGIIKFHRIFESCSSLTSIPLLNISNATYVAYMFKGCTNVESGSLEMYNQLSALGAQVTDHDGCFLNCGSNTVTGAAELAQIPSSWGGTGA